MRVNLDDPQVLVCGVQSVRVDLDYPQVVSCGVHLWNTSTRGGRAEWNSRVVE